MCKYMYWTSKNEWTSDVQILLGSFRMRFSSQIRKICPKLNTWFDLLVHTLLTTQWRAESVKWLAAWPDLDNNRVQELRRSSPRDPSLRVKRQKREGNLYVHIVPMPYIQISHSPIPQVYNFYLFDNDILNSTVLQLPIMEDENDKAIKICS
jgi:hypothetical protein